MTKVMIIGSSHVGAYKNAEDAFKALYPKLDVSFFAVRGPLFLMGSMDANGIFTPSFRNDKDRDLVRETNGVEVADASGADHVVMVGHRFAFNNLTALLEDYDILEGVRTGRANLMSETFVKEIIENGAIRAAQEAAAMVKDFGKPVTFAMAPYPASSIVARAKTYEMARRLELFWGRPDAAWAFEYWLGQVRKAIEGSGHRLLIQPDTLVAGPHATKSEFATRAASVGGDTLAKIDHRHMNADFGLAMMCEYAENHLGLRAIGARETMLNKRIA